ncbi:endonuclease/exonuclease/phosphatase family protein [Pimelobacter simplex]|uniref:endonuclease/exonuclease/phosphatase family protein n=1 Tax=Nocardioides simplex TaxID=2045 RepID=UPI00214F635F|nr:endonuclease/exonuclease/phosphatase family protein [Pimelobacter simplex]UUW92500.1 transglycosylase SLT domain-containing protein [Pimelobacter simplex]UUW96328.1 transglycosylase SLT domain-containing protein [Pimelobacter simplex]
MKKGILLGLPLVLIAPLMLLLLGTGNASIEAVRAACATGASGSGSGSFGIGTLNWRGASHYTKNPHPGERPYGERVPNMVSKIGASGASIIGFQEFEPPQAQAFLRATNGTWRIVAGQRQGHRSTADAIAYQPGVWTVDEVRHVSIRYGGPMIQVPLVRFTSTVGGSVWVLNAHNPANAVGGTKVMRDAAVRAEATALRQLQASDHDTALFLVGDMNDKARFKRLFLSVAGPGWSSANPTDQQIDWILGGPAVTFSGTVVDRSTNDRAHNYTDHPFVHTTAHLTGPGPDRPEPTGTQPGGTTSTGCPPCPPLGNFGVDLLQNVSAPSDLDAAKVAAMAAYQAGFRGEDLITAVAIARVESTWNPRATNGTHFGLWQISVQHRGTVPGWNTQAAIFDPLLNAKYAFALYSARSGSGEAKFADWTPFQNTDYHRYLDAARRAVAAIERGTTNIADTGCTASPIQVAQELSAALSARVNTMMRTDSGLCSLSWTSGAPCTYKNQCPKIVDAVYGGPGVGRGYGNGEDVAQGIINAGLAQSHGTGLDPLPPVGAVVSYNRGDGIGHVAIYVGGGKIFGNDYGCAANGLYGCVGFADVHTPSGSVTWALPKQAFDLGGMPAAAA